MSSILNALKKLEKEPPPKDETQTFQQQIDTKRAISKRARSAWRIRNFVSLLVIVILIGGAWLAWDQRSVLQQKFFPDTDAPEKKTERVSPPVAKKETPPVAPVRTPEKAAPRLPKKDKTLSSQPEKETGTERELPPRIHAVSEHEPDTEEIAAAIAPPVKKTETKSANLPKLSGRERKALDQLKQKIEELDKSKKLDKSFMKEQAEALELLKKKIAELEQKHGTTSVQKMDKTSIKEQAETLNVLKEKIVEMGQKYGTAKSAARTSMPEDSAPPIPKMSSADLKIQALVWSDEPADRWVMINNRIIKTGGYVDDIIVTEIANDHIIIRENGEEKKVRFQLK